jgi:hypothetical protein
VLSNARVSANAARVLRVKGAQPTLEPPNSTGAETNANAEIRRVTTIPARARARTGRIGNGGSLSSHPPAATIPAITVLKRGKAAGGSRTVVPIRSN